MDRHWRTRSRLAGLALAFGLWALVAPTAAAGPREQAKRMHDRLVGVPPSDAVLASMEASISGGDPLAAANTAMADPVFYKSALKNWVTPWTNVPGNVFADLNDYTATVIGMVRDDVPFNTVLSADLVYTGAPGVVSARLLADRQPALPAARAAGRRSLRSRTSSSRACSRPCRARC